MDSVSQLADLLTNPWMNIVAIIIGVVGIVLSMIFYLRSRRVKSPCYAYRSTNIIRDLVSKFESLEMLYADQPIRNLTVTKIVFWNAGRDTINKEDVVQADPISMRVKGDVKILDAKILSKKHDVNKYNISQSDDRSKVTLGFDYVDKDEGVAIQLIHTGTSSKDIEVSGTVKGAGKIVKKQVSKIKASRIRILGLKSQIMMGPRQTALIYLFLPLTMMPLMFQNPDTTTVILFLATTFLLWVTGIMIYGAVLPKSLEVFDEFEV